ncbi:MAG: 23S rRNA (uracil(1939)-C(5))-methyltransferase RlmD [Planctomycetes bacterium]|nr:23S rRNA (uracil(1939)-C(5))-methyltransferase RlmD [Planctomycetota bacterium]
MAKGLPLDRATPSTLAPVHCPHFGPCGGCSLLDVRYTEEVGMKEAAFAALVRGSDALRKAKILPLLRAREPLFYRTSLKVPFGRKDGAVVAGFFKRRTHSIVDLAGCAIQDPLLTELMLDVKRLAAAIGVSIYDERSHHGVLRHFLARVGAGTRELLAGFVVRTPGDAAIRELALATMEAWSGRGLVGVVENVNRERTNVILGEATTTLVGRGHLDEEADDLRSRTPLEAFVQVNAAQASALYREVVRRLGPLDGKRVVDLYSGFGPIALRVARAGAHVVAIERNQVAAREGALAADDNGLADRVTFLAADAEHGLRATDAAGLDAVVVDPPRRGLAPGLIATLKSLAFRRLVYVSCNPETFVRDLEALAPDLRVVELRPVDLFPRTEHLESIAVLDRVHVDRDG